MSREISIAISARDNFTQAITTMRNANSSFNKDLTGTSEKLDALNKNKVTLKIDADKAKSELKEAEKQFLSTGSAADKMKLELASANYDNTKRNLDLVSKNARQAEKDILSMTDAVSKADNRAGSGKSAGIAGTVSAIAQAGFTKMIGDSVSQIANTAVSSAFGSATGNMFGSTLSGAASGAAMGSLIAPGIGTAIGAAAGGVLGAVNGAVQNFQNEDDAFKSAVQTEYSSVTQGQKDALSSGTTIAGNREQNQISFSTMLGSKEKAGSFLSQITDFAARTPFEYDDLTKISRTMLAYGYKQNQIIPELTKIGDTGSALGMSTEDMNYVATSLGRMRTTGKTTLEYLNPLLERGIPVWDYLSKASGKTKEQVQEMVSKGLVPGGEAARAISDYMGKANKNSMELQSHTYQGLQSSLQDAQDSLNAAMGTGYNEERKKGIQAQIDYLGGSDGKKMQEAYSVIGQYQASLENAHEKAIRDAMKGAMETDDYKKAVLQNDGAEAGRIVAQAKADAEAKYRETNQFKQEQDSQVKLVNGVQSALAPVYKTFGYNMGQEFSKGLASTVRPGIESALNPNSYLRSNSIGGSQTGKSSQGNSNSGISSYLMQNATGHATGSFRVPYNNYPALLHEGEVINTAVEARSGKSAPSAVIMGNNFYVREEADIDKVARSLAEKIEHASLVS